jgi:hypothetical protein
MRYLIYLTSGGYSFFTEWFGDGLVPDQPYVCFDLVNGQFTTDNVNWQKITEDHL